MAGIYLHIPFCKQACHYCDFHFSTQLGNMEALVLAMVSELKSQHNFFGPNATIDTIYFGGGTPSLLNSNQLAALLVAIRDAFKVNPAAEITLEANPDDISTEAIASWMALGINRLSIGIQTFNQQALVYCNRAHNSHEALNAVRLAQEAGLTNLSIDLMFGIPNSGPEVWTQDLVIALQLGVPHISAYCLTVEPGTAFGNWAKQGKLLAVDDDLAAMQYDELVATLKAAGYEHYEVSSFALPSQYAQHNTNYWRYLPYLGIGPSAHSFDGNARYANVANNNQYLKGINQNQDIPTWRTAETLTADEKVGEYLLTSLRTQWGADLAYLNNQLGYQLNEHLNTLIKQWVVAGLALYQPSKSLILTDAGRLMADHLTLKLLP